MNNNKMEIALAIRNSAYGNKLGCTLIDNAVLKSCGSCNLECICEGIRAVAKDYEASTSRVVRSFDFKE